MVKENPSQLAEPAYQPKLYAKAGKVRISVAGLGGPAKFRVALLLNKRQF